MQAKTLSLDNAFAANQLQHTGEFHDCIPLPVFDASALDLKKIGREENKEEAAAGMEGIILLAPFVDVVLIPGEPDPRYLNFITSVEDDFCQSPKGVIIEDVTSLTDKSDDSRPSTAVELKVKSSSIRREESLSDVSMNIEEVLGLGEEDAGARGKLIDKNSSQESQDGVRTPVTVMEKTKSEDKSDAEKS